MDPFVAQLPSDLLEMAFTLALVAGVVLILGAIVSFGVFAYRSVRGEGMKDPREVAPEKTKDDENGLTKGDSDDEWDYY